MPSLFCVEKKKAARQRGESKWSLINALSPLINITKTCEDSAKVTWSSNGDKKLRHGSQDGGAWLARWIIHEKAAIKGLLCFILSFMASCNDLLKLYSILHLL